MEQGIEIRVVDEYSALDRLALSGGEEDPAGVSALGLSWLPKSRHVLVVRDGAVVAHAGLVLQVVRVGARAISVAGVGGVLTHPDCRGRGLGAMAMEAVEEIIRRERLAGFGMLFCREEKRAWYERMGWKLVADPVWIEQPGGTRLWPMAAMVKGFAEETWPSGEVRTESLPW